jgi:hypothetical protein
MLASLITPDFSEITFGPRAGFPVLDLWCFLRIGDWCIEAESWCGHTWQRQMCRSS